MVKLRGLDTVHDILVNSHVPRRFPQRTFNHSRGDESADVDKTHDSNESVEFIAYGE